MFYWALLGYELRVRQAVIFSVSLAFLYAISDELHQTFVSGRSGEVSDVLIDTIGALAGVIASSSLKSPSHSRWGGWR